MGSKKNIVLIGMPAAGKSTVGVLLAKKTGLGFTDTDVVIQTLVGKKLSEIIESEGVNGFCHIEEKSVLTMRVVSQVIATGGSVVYGEKAMEYLSENGVIVYLDIALELLEQRLTDLDGRGVIRAPDQSIEKLYDERHPLYEKYADIKVRCDGLTPDQVVGKIMEAISA